MALSIALAKTSFAAGEVSAELRVRSDLAKNQTGCWLLENMVVLLEGGVTRRPGTRMITPYKNAAQAAAFIPFRFSGGASNAYLIVINGGVARFILGNAVVQAGGGGPYEVAVPYTDADLGGAGATIPGVSNLRWTSSGNQIFLFCDGHEPQVLTRLADNNWTLTPYLTAPNPPVPQGGCIEPVDTENLDPAQSISASAMTGAIVLNSAAGGPAFNANHLDTVWRLDESDLSLIPEWVPNENIVLPTQDFTATAAGNIGDMTNLANAFDNNLATDATKVSTLSFFAGRNWAAAQAVYSVTIIGDQVNDLVVNNPPNSSVLPTATLSIYAKNGAPANATDGTLLGTAAFSTTNPPVVHTVFSGNAFATFTHIWLAGVPAVASDIAAAEIKFQQFTAVGSPIYRRFNGNVYQAITGGNSGGNPPTHTSGAVLSGPGGIAWKYIHRDRGFAQITQINSAISANATVLETLPYSVTKIPTPNFWPPAWDGTKGWPTRVALFGNALVAARKGKVWKTQPGTFFDWDIVDPSSAESAIAAQLLSPKGSQVDIEWFYQDAFLAAGARDDEWSLAGQDPFSPITVANLNPYPSNHKGSAVHIPAFTDGAVIFISRSRKRLYYGTLEFGGVMPKIKVEELTLSARHILVPQARGVSYQQDPNQINWIWCADGSLVGETLMVDQQINGWHRHPLTNGAVEQIATIPSSDEGVSWTYFGVRRVINGQAVKFIELLQPFFTPANPAAPDATGAWFLDCALQYTGAPTQTIIGLDHLNGERVGVHADGCMYLNPDGTLPVVGAVPGGIGITLTRPTQNCVVGLPINYKIRLLPLDIETQHGSTAGSRQKANHVFLRLVNAAGGNCAVNPDEGGVPEPITETSLLTYGVAMTLFTGLWRSPGLEAALADQMIVEITGNDTMPFTLSGVDPDVMITEQT